MEFTVKWIKQLRSAYTIKAYARHLGEFLKWARSQGYVVSRPESVTRTMCVEWYRELCKRHGEVTPSGVAVVTQTAHTKFTALSSWLSFGLVEGLINRNPALGVVKERPLGKQHQPVPLRVAKRIAEVGVDMDWGRYPGAAQEANGEVFRLAMLALLATGCRKVEVCNLKVKHFSEGLKPALTFIGKGGRTRAVPISPEVAAAFTAHVRRFGLRPDDQLCWVPSAPPLNIDSLAWMFKRVSAYHGVKLTAHQIRATVASYMHDSGATVVDLQKLLGHKNPATTSNYVTILDAKRISPSLRINSVPARLTAPTRFVRSKNAASRTTNRNHGRP